jgi:flagellar basal body rod protein FlgB
MMIDFDKLMELAKTPIEFEKERARIINDYIKSLPPEKQDKAKIFQAELDQKRKEMSSAKFLEYTSNRMVENAETIKHKVEQITNPDLQDCIKKVGYASEKVYSLLKK